MLCPLFVEPNIKCNLSGCFGLSIQWVYFHRNCDIQTYVENVILFGDPKYRISLFNCSDVKVNQNVYTGNYDRHYGMYFFHVIRRLVVECWHVDHGRILEMK